MTAGNWQQVYEGALKVKIKNLGEIVVFKTKATLLDFVRTAYQVRTGASDQEAALEVTKQWIILDFSAERGYLAVASAKT